MTPYERAVELARQCVDDPLPVIVCKVMAEAMREAAAQDQALADERMITKRYVNGRIRQAHQEAALQHETCAAEYEQAAKEHK